MNKKTFSVLIIVVVVAIISWIFLFSKEKSAVVQEITEFPTTYNTKDISLTKKARGSPTFTTLNFQETPEKEQSYFNKSLSFLNPEIEVFQKIVPIIEQFSSIFYDEPQNQQGIKIILPEKPKLSEVEIEQIIFNKLYPNYFTEGLTFTQNVFVEQSFLDEDYEIIDGFDSEEKIFAFVNTIIDVFEEQGFYSKEEAIKFRVGANIIWKNVIELDRVEIQKEIVGSEFYKKILKHKIFNIRKSNARIITNMFEIIRNMPAKKTYAADCYRSGFGTPGPGANLVAPCCNCGLKCSSHGCVPVSDCGIGGRSCDIPLGCKNLYGVGRPVIWDSSSGICGIG